MILSSIDLDLRQRRVERRRLAAAGRAGDQHHAVRLGDVLAEPPQLVLREAEDVEPQLAELLADRFLVEDTDDRVLAVHARHDRDAEVDRLAAARRSLKRPSCGTRFSAMSSSAMTLMREMIVLWKRLSIGRIAGCSTPSMRYFTCTASSCVSMWMSLARRWSAVKIVESTSRMTGLVSARQLLDGEVLVAVLVLAQDLHLEALGGFLEHALRALALLQDRLDRRRRARPSTLIGVPSSTPSSSIIGRSVGSRHDDDQRLPFAPVRHEAVAQHQIRGDRAEQLVVDAELREVDELEPVALGQPPRPARSRPPARRRSASAAPT